MLPASVRVRIFGLTWLSYASIYLTRKNFSAGKTTVQEDTGASKQDLAYIDTGYLAAYAVGQFVWGFVADRVGPRRVIAFGMLAAAIASTAFGRADTVLAMALIWIGNGVAQATGWAAGVKAMTEVPPPGQRGRVMGWWTTNYVVGGLVATWLAGIFLAQAGRHGVFTYPAIIVAAVGILVLLFLPDAAGAAPVRLTAEQAAAARAERRAARAVVVRQARVWILGASYFFMKLARYALLFWLPFYAQKALGYDKITAINTSIAFEVGGAIGAMTIGLLSDRLFGGRRFVVGMVALVCLAGCFVAYEPLSRQGIPANLFGLALIGFFLFGPDAILSGAAAQDLGGPQAAAAAAGIINGMGSVGPVLGSLVWPLISTMWGWNTAFAILGAGALLSALILFPVRRVAAAPAPSAG